MNINSSQSVAWDAVAGATAYDVELHGNPPAGVLSGGSFEKTGTSIAASELLAGRAFGSFNVRTRAKEAAGPGAWTAFLNLDFVALPAPSNLRVV
jgi:hypothetical protein